MSGRYRAWQRALALACTLLIAPGSAPLNAHAPEAAEQKPNLTTVTGRRSARSSFRLSRSRIVSAHRPCVECDVLVFCSPSTERRSARQLLPGRQGSYSLAFVSVLSPCALIGCPALLHRGRASMSLL